MYQYAVKADMRNRIVANYRESTVSPSDRQQCYAENPTSFISW